MYFFGKSTLSLTWFEIIINNAIQKDIVVNWHSFGYARIIDASERDFKIVHGFIATYPFMVIF